MSRRNDDLNVLAGLSMVFSWADTSLFYLRWFNGCLKASTYRFVPTIRTLAFAIEINALTSRCEVFRAVIFRAVIGVSYLLITNQL